MKKIILVAMVMVIALSSFTFANDIKGHWAEEKIKQNKAIQGYPDGTFKPDKNISVAEFIKVFVISNMNDLRNEEIDKNNHWAEKYVYYLEKEFENIDYKLEEYDRPITREEVAEIVYYYMLENGKTKGGKTPFENDNKFIQNIYHSNIMKGYPDGTFRKKGNTTRAEATVVLERIYENLRPKEVEVSDKNNKSEIDKYFGLKWTDEDFKKYHESDKKKYYQHKSNNYTVLPEIDFENKTVLIPRKKYHQPQVQLTDPNDCEYFKIKNSGTKVYEFIKDYSELALRMKKNGYKYPLPIVKPSYVGDDMNYKGFRVLVEWESNFDVIDFHMYGSHHLEGTKYFPEYEFDIARHTVLAPFNPYLKDDIEPDEYVMLGEHKMGVYKYETLKDEKIMDIQKLFLFNLYGINDGEKIHDNYMKGYFFKGEEQYNEGKKSNLKKEAGIYLVDDRYDEVIGNYKTNHVNGSGTKYSIDIEEKRSE